MGGVSSVCFSSDGTHLYVGGAAGVFSAKMRKRP
jgi:hypothetical protein